MFGDHAQVERHADGEEEEAEQQAAKRLDIRFKLMAETRIRKQDPGEERAHRHRQPAQFQQLPRTEYDQERCRHHLARLAAGEQAESRVEQPVADRHQQRDAGERLADAQPQRCRALRMLRREEGDEGEQRHNQQILEEEDGDHFLPAWRGQFMALAEDGHDDGGRSEDKPGGADEGNLPGKAVEDADGGQQHRRQHHLHAAEAENLAAQMPEVRGLHFQPDDEEKNHHPELGDVQNRGGILK